MNFDAKQVDTIGVAWMEDDGTIVLRLRAEGPGVVGMGTLRYEKDHPQYKDILLHVGPLEPGQHKPVAPWPD